MELKIQKIKNNITELIEIINKHESLYRTETYHKLRVDIKKLRAYLNLMTFCCPQYSYQENFKNFRILFKKAGKVREINIEKKLILNFINTEPIKHYLDYLSNQLHIRKNIFFAWRNQQKLKEFTKAFRKIKYNQPCIKKSKKYFSIKQKKIYKLCKKRKLNITQYHTLRKTLKEFLYNHILVFSNERFSFLKDFKKLSKLLGEWHDVIDVKSHLEKMMNKSHVFETELKSIKKILLKISASEVKLLSSIDLIRNNMNQNSKSKA